MRIARALLALLFVSLSAMRPQISVGGLAMVPTDAIAVLAASCWLVACAVDRRQWRWDTIFALFVLYFAAMLLSALVAKAPFATFLPRLAGELYLLGLPVLILGAVDTADDLRRLCLAWLVGTGLVLMLAIVTLATAWVDPAATWLPLVQHHLGSLPLGPFVRYRIAYENPNMLGAYLTASLMVALLALTCGWIRRATGVALFAGLGLTLAITFSAGIGGAILGAAIWFHLRQGTTCPRVACLVLIGAIGAALAFVAAQVVTPVGYPDPWFALPVPGTDIALFPSSRLRVWTEALATFRAHPLTGVGIGRHVANLAFDEPGGAHVMLYDGHNVLLNLAAGCGVLGATAIVAILVAIARRTGPLDGTTHPARLAFGIGVLDILVYQGIGGGFEDARFVWAMIGLLLAAMRLDRAGAFSTRKHELDTLLPRSPLCDSA